MSTRVERADRGESARIIDRLRLHGALTASDAALRLRIVTEWLEAVELVLLRPPILRRASELLPTGLGTLDAIHLATALVWRGARVQLRRGRRVSSGSHPGRGSRPVTAGTAPTSSSAAR